jgi:hypothetical protein
VRRARVTLFRFEVVQGGRGHRENLYIDPAFIHKRDAPLPQIVQPLLNVCPIERRGAFLPKSETLPMPLEFQRLESALQSQSASQFCLFSMSGPQDAYL